MLKSIFSKTTSTKYQVPSTKYNTNTLLTILIFGLLMLGLQNNAMAQEPPCPFCCDRVNITPEITDSCCVEFTITYFTDGLYCDYTYVEFYSKTSSDPTFDLSDQVGRVPIGYGETKKFIMCPLEGETSLYYQIKLTTANPNLPRCTGNQQPHEFVEGCTQFTDTLDLSECCECPPAINASVIEDPGCPSGCKLVLDWVDSTKVECYNYYVFQDFNSSHNNDNLISLSQNPISEIEYCLEAGEISNIVIYLFKEFTELPTPEEACPVPVIVECDSCACPPRAWSSDGSSEGDFIKLPKTPSISSFTIEDTCCKAVYDIRIPRGNSDCYEYWKFEVLTPGYEHFTETGTFTQTSEDGYAKSFSHCLEEGEVPSSRLIMSRYADFRDSCVIESIGDSCDPNLYYPEPCYPDHEEVQFTEEYKKIAVTSSLCPGCEITGVYTHRKISLPDGTERQDMQILEMQLPPGCDGCDLGLLWKELVKGIYQLNEMGFEPTLNEQCFEQNRVGMGSCWAEYTAYGGIEIPGPFPTIQPDSIKFWSKCDETECCWQEIEVCRDAAGNVDITPLPNGSRNDSCENIFFYPLEFIPNPYGDYWTTNGEFNPYWIPEREVPCLPKCDWLDEIGDYQGKINGNIEVLEKEIELLNGYRLNISKNSIFVDILTRQNSYAVFQIFDLQGNLVYKEKQTMPMGQNTYLIDLTKLNTGTYLFVIEIDNKEIKTEKFIITK